MKLIIYCLVVKSLSLLMSLKKGHKTFGVSMRVPDSDEAAANVIRFIDHIIMPADFPKTETMLRAKGLTTICVGNNERAKFDGGMSRSSLRL